MRLRLLAIAVAIAGMAFAVVRDDDANQPVVWASTPVTYVIQQNGSDDIGDGSDLQAIRDALAAWEPFQRWVTESAR